jgi:hypothetical protein
VNEDGGWNGTLVLTDDRVVIKRGLKGLVVRKRRDPDFDVPFKQVARVRYAPARGVAGYVQIKRGSSGTDDYLGTIRDPRTVTFVTRSVRWRRVAQEIADLSGATLEPKPAAAYWRSVFGSAGARRR